jgi:hypothetical protein
MRLAHPVNCSYNYEPKGLLAPSRIFNFFLYPLLGGKSNDEIYSLAWVVVHFDLAPMGNDNSVDNGQAQTQTGFFCGIEGIEDIMKVFWINPLPGIFHLHLDIR